MSLHNNIQKWHYNHIPLRETPMTHFSYKERSTPHRNIVVVVGTLGRFHHKDVSAIPIPTFIVLNLHLLMDSKALDPSHIQFHSNLFPDSGERKSEQTR